MSENLFSRRFWIGDADARILALYRILLGLTLLYDGLDRLRDFHAFYSERGLMPRAVEFASRSHFAWSLFDMIEPWPVELALYLAGMAALVAFAAGYRTRVAALASWIFLMSIQHRNDLVLDGSDVVLRVMLFWMLFADAGACWSLDVRLHRRAPRARVPAHPLGFLRLQFALVYIFTTIDKWHGGWWDGNYLHQVMQSFDFVRWLGPSLLPHPELCRLLTRGTLFAEALIPLLLLSPFLLTRLVGLLGNFVLQAGIFLTLAVGNFPGVMITASVIFLTPQLIDRLLWRLLWRLPWRLPWRWARPIAVVDQPRLPRTLGLAAGGVLLTMVIGSVAAFSFRQNYPLNDALELTGLRQSWPMFANGLPNQGHWLAPGELTDGTQLEVFAQTAPGLLTSRAGARYSRWYKFRFGLAFQNDYTVFDAVGRYLCRRYNGTTSGPRLRELEIQYWDESVPPPGDPPPVATRVDMYHTRCIEAEPPEPALRRTHNPFVSPPQP